MDLVIFIEKGLFAFAEALWVAYLIFAVEFYFAKFVPGRLALKRFQRLRKLHWRIFLPVLCLFVFYELTPYGSLNEVLTLCSLSAFLLSLGSFGLLKQALAKGLAGLVGKTVMLEIYADEEKTVSYGIVYRNKVLEQIDCPRYCWEGYTLNAGDVFSALVEDDTVRGKAGLKLKIFK